MPKTAGRAPKVKYEFPREYVKTTRHKIKSKKDREDFIATHLDEVFELGKIGCNVQEVLAVLGISYEFYETSPLKAEHERGLQNSKIKIRRKLFQLIDEDCVPAILYACKTILRLREFDPILDAEKELADRNVFKLAYQEPHIKYVHQAIEAKESKDD